MTRTAAIVVAAGTGTRLGADVPKAFVKVAGRPMLGHVARAFRRCAIVDDLVVVVGSEHINRACRILLAAEWSAADFAVCEGGETRQESVVKGLERCPEDANVVAVHDAARALVTAQLIADTVAALEPPWDGVAPGLPVVDTLKIVDGTQGGVIRTADRRGLWTVQTPQAFTPATLERVHDRMRETTATDDLSLVEQSGGRVRLIPGERRNFKITYPEDLAMAEALLRGSA